MTFLCYLGRKPEQKRALLKKSTLRGMRQPPSEPSRCECTGRRKHEERGKEGGKGILIKTSKQGVRELCLHDFGSSHKDIFVPRGAVEFSTQSLR